MAIGAAAEIRTPLNAVLGMTDLALDSAVEKVETYGGGVIRRAGVLARCGASRPR